LPTITKVERKGKQVEASFRSETPIVAAALHFTTDSGPWQKRKWQTRPAKLERDRATVELPPDRPLVYFMTLTDDRKATISTEHDALDATVQPKR